MIKFWIEVVCSAALSGAASSALTLWAFYRWRDLRARRQRRQDENSERLRRDERAWYESACHRRMYTSPDIATFERGMRDMLDLPPGEDLDHAPHITPKH